MNILFLSLRCPYPPHRGDRIRAYHFIKQLAQRHSLTVVCFVESDEDIDNLKHLQPFCDRIEYVRFQRNHARLNTLLRCFSKQPFQLHYWYAKEMQHTIDKVLDETDFDLIQVQFFRMAQYVSTLQEIPRVLDLADSMALNLSRRVALDRSIKRHLVKLEERRARRYELEITKSFDWATVVSPFDQDYLLKQDATLNLSVVPMGVDLEYFQPTTTEPQPHLLFTGTMSYFPNSDAVLYFTQEIFPIIRKARPEITFYIVGNYPPQQIQQLANGQDIVVTGHVPDTRPYFEKASVFVAPLRSGSGMQAKNLEAMGMGVPVVTTSIGALGLDANVGQDLLIADTPDTFAKHVINLIEDPSHRQTVGNAGRKLVETKYDWQVLIQGLENIYSQICH
jgi:sugar transferase (PEP-CTERM/EpsH1 system associated)